MTEMIMLSFYPRLYPKHVPQPFITPQLLNDGSRPIHCLRSC